MIAQLRKCYTIDLRCRDQYAGTDIRLEDEDYLIIETADLLATIRSD